MSSSQRSNPSVSPFDAYHELLGIPPSEQPPTHYRLLGLSPFESTPSVIERAADRQMKHLHEFKTGAHSADSQRLLNEVAKARRVLLNDSERAAYDEQLRASSFAPNDLGPAAATDQPVWLQPSPVQSAASAYPVALGRSVRRHRSSSSLLVVAAIVGVVVCSVGALVYALSTDSSPSVANKSVRKAPDKKPARMDRMRESTSAPTPFMANRVTAIPEGPAASTTTSPPREQSPAEPLAAVATDGLQGSWSFDERSGEIVADDTGNGSTGTLFGDMQRVAGWQGEALQFNGKDAFVNLGRPPALSIHGQITLAAWIRPEATDGFRNVVAQGHTSNPNGEIFLRVQDGQYYVGYWDGETYSANYPVSPEDNSEWVHLAGTFDGTQWNLYRNGALVASAAEGMGVAPVESNWIIGAGAGGTERFFRGAIDEVRIYNRALTPQEVAELADASTTSPGSDGGMGFQK